MTDALDDLGATFAKHDLDSKLSSIESKADALASVHDELRHHLDGNDPAMGESERGQVKEAFDQIVREDITALREGSFEPGEFAKHTEDIVDDLEEILQSPQAEAVVEDLQSWLLGTGLEPLSEERLAELREVVKQDIGTAEQAVRDAKTAHDGLRGYLGDAQSDVDQIVLEEVQSITSIEDFDTLAEGLEKLDNAWVGDWTFDFSTGAGETLMQNFIDLLEENLKNEISNQSTINGLSAVVGQRAERWDRALDNIGDSWLQIENRAKSIDPHDASFTAEDALELISNQLGPAESLSRYRSVVNTTEEALGDLQQAQQIQLGDYRHDEGSVPDELEEYLDTIENHASEIERIRSKMFGADTAQKIKDLKDDLETEHDALKEAFNELNQAAISEVKTTRKFASKFNLDEQQEELNDQYTDLNSADTVVEVIEVFEEYLETAGDVQEPVRDQLDESEESLFIFILEHSDQDSAGEIWDKLTAEFERDRESLVEDVASLEEKDLLDLSITIA